jgi:hypothetical protein
MTEALGMLTGCQFRDDLSSPIPPRRVPRCLTNPLRVGPDGSTFLSVLHNDRNGIEKTLGSPLRGAWSATPNSNVQILN